MAPHSKCGSGQPVAGSNPALSATYATHANANGCWPTPVLAHAGTVGPMASGASPRTSGGGALAPVLGRRLGLRARAGGWRSSWFADPTPSTRALITRFAVDSAGRARRGTSGALYLQTAPAGLNSHPRSPFSRAAASSDVEDRVPRSGESRTVSGPEGSSTKRTSSGAAERPGPSRSLRWARKRPGRRWVHGNQLPLARDRTGAL